MSSNERACDRSDGACDRSDAAASDEERSSRPHTDAFPCEGDSSSSSEDEKGIASPPPNKRQFSSHGVRFRRSKYFKRQSRVQPDERGVRKQTSEPTTSHPAATSVPMLQKHESYPQYATAKSRRLNEVSSLLIRAVTVIDRQSSSTTTSGGSLETASEPPQPQGQRASHTPAVRSGPPLSCNFCWNTVDECGRILRRKTQYHCPECRTNLCIVPCFHEYHDGPVEPDAAASAI